MLHDHAASPAIEWNVLDLFPRISWKTKNIQLISLLLAVVVSKIECHTWMKRKSTSHQMMRNIRNKWKKRRRRRKRTTNIRWWIEFYDSDHFNSKLISHLFHSSTHILLNNDRARYILCKFRFYCLAFSLAQYSQKSEMWNADQSNYLVL